MSVSTRSILQLGQVVGSYFHAVLYEVDVLSPTPLVNPPDNLDRYKYFDKVMQELSHGQTEERIFYQTLSLIKDHMLELMFHPEAVHIFRMNAIIKSFDTVIKVLDKILLECRGNQPLESLRGLEGFTKSIKRLALEYYQGCVNAKIGVLPLNYTPPTDPLVMTLIMSSSPVSSITIPRRSSPSPMKLAPEFIPSSDSPVNVSQDQPVRTSSQEKTSSQDRPVRTPPQDKMRTPPQEKTPVRLITRPKSTPPPALNRSSSPVVKAPLNSSVDSYPRTHALPIYPQRIKRERNEPPQSMTMLWYRQHNYTEFFIGRPISFNQGHLAGKRCTVIKVTDSSVTCRFMDGSHNLVKTNIPLTWYERN